MTEIDLKHFARFVKATGKGAATRYGRPSEPIRPDVVVALSHEEAARYRREYKRQIAEGAIEDVDGEAYVAFVKKQREEAQAEQKAREEAKAKAEAEAKAKAQAEAKAKGSTKNAPKSEGGSK